MRPRARGHIRPPVTDREPAGADDRHTKKNDGKGAGFPSVKSSQVNRENLTESM